MTSEAETFLANIKEDAVASIDFKYRKGDAKYDGTLLDLTLEQLVTHALAENIDQYTYLKAIENKIKVK
jgi:hypothetical protein